MSLRTHQILWTFLASIAPLFFAWLSGSDFEGRSPQLAFCVGLGGVFGFFFYYCPAWFKRN